MSVLSAQSIFALSLVGTRFMFRPMHGNDTEIIVKEPLITPLVLPRRVVNGKSYGLSACTYDCRIAHDLLLPVGQARLAATMERFCFPHMVCGSVLDKSSWARVFVSAFNTHLDPGWEGYLTVELVNLGEEVADYRTGDPVCQVKFEWLDFPTEMPYRGKYQNQGEAPQPAIQESSDKLTPEEQEIASWLSDLPPSHIQTQGKDG